MEPCAPMATEWTDTKKDLYTLGNGMVILPNSRYKRVQGSLGVAVRVSGMILAGVVESRHRDADKDDNSTSSRMMRRGLFVNVLPSESPTPYRLHTFDGQVHIGWYLTMQKGSHLDSDLVLHGPFS